MEKAKIVQTYNDRYVEEEQDKNLDVIRLIVDRVEVIIVGKRQYLQVVIHFRMLDNIKSNQRIIRDHRANNEHNGTS